MASKLNKLVSDFGKYLQEKRVRNTGYSIFRDGKTITYNVRSIAAQFDMTPNDWFRLERGHFEQLLPFIVLKDGLTGFYKTYKFFFGSDPYVRNTLHEIKHLYQIEQNDSTGPGNISGD